MDGFLHGRRHCERVPIRSQLEDHQRVSFDVLGVGNVKERQRLAGGDDLKFNVASDPDDFQLAIFLAGHAEGAADGVLIGPELFSRALADHGHVSALLIVGVSKGAAADHPDTHHAEVFGRNDVVSGA